MKLKEGSSMHSFVELEGFGLGSISIVCSISYRFEVVTGSKAFRPLFVRRPPTRPSDADMMTVTALEEAIAGSSG